MAGLHRPPIGVSLARAGSPEGALSDREAGWSVVAGALARAGAAPGPQVLRWQVRSSSGGLCCAHSGASAWHPVRHRCKRVNSAEGQNRKQQLLTPAGTGWVGGWGHSDEVGPGHSVG